MKNVHTFCVLIPLLVAGSIFSEEPLIDSEYPMQIHYETMQRPVLYIPWREAYTVSSSDKQQMEKPCPFCRIKNDDEDTKNLVLARLDHTIVLLNLYPYTRGHLLIVPNEHVKRIGDLSLQCQAELIWLIGKSVDILETVGKADGVNVGINLGAAANASIPEHLHIQLVPRFNKEFWAFLQLIGESRVIFWDLHKLFEEFQPHFEQLKSLQ